MRTLLLASTFALAMVSAFPALAQVSPVYTRPFHAPGALVVTQHQYQLDQHRYQMGQLRYEADRRQALAGQMALETQLRRQALQSARAPEPIQPMTARPLYAPEIEAGLARSAAARRETVAAGVSQIDAWLDRAP